MSSLVWPEAWRGRRFFVAATAAIALVAVFGAPAALAQGPSVGFATPTMVSPFIPGFEPDVAVDPSPTAGQGQTYTSTPFGFSTTESFIFRSNDGRRSFHFVEGNALGKPTTCIGGGDSELQIDPLTGQVFFSDLQGLTNFSNSTSTDAGRTWQTSCTAVVGAGVDRQWIGLDTNAGHSAIGAGAGAGRLYEDYDNVEQNSDQDNLLGNQLVMNESVDGVHYGSNCVAAGAPCPGPPAVITRDEGIPGNVVVDNTGGPFDHTVYAVHTGSLDQSVIVSRCRGKAGDTTAAQVAADCTDPTQVALGDPGHVNVNWHDSAPRPQGAYRTGNLFASIALDSAGNVYVVWSEYPVDKSGNDVGPGVVRMSVSTDGGATWRGPFQVSPSNLGQNVMPWVTAGDPGRVGVAWYGGTMTSEGGLFAPDAQDHGIWNVYYAQALDALGAGGPHFSVSKVSDHQAKFGNISTAGFGGSPDRSLGDFMQVKTGVNGEAVISYVDDTSADRNPDYCMGCGQTPSEAAGPIMIATQDSGPSLFAAKGNVAGPAPAFNSVTDPVGVGYPDAFLSALGTDTNASPNLDISGVTVTKPDASHLRFTMSTADSNLTNDLTASPTLGGPEGEWIVRWAAPTYSHPSDGNIFYVGMQAGSNGAPQFYSGTTCAIGTTHTKFFTYPTTTTIPGSISGGTITWTVPLSAVGGPVDGQGLFSITGFTATQPLPSSSTGSTGCSAIPAGSGSPNLPNLIDASAPFTYGVGGSLNAAGGGARSAAALPALRLSVSPRRTLVGCHRFTFHTTHRAGGRTFNVRGARIRFNGRRSKATGKRGRVRMRSCVRRVRTYRAQASRKGFRPATASVRTRRRARRAGSPRFTG